MNVLKKILRYEEFYGDRIAWKIGNLDAEEPWGRRAGQFSTCLDINIESGTFADYEHHPFRTVAEYVDHSLCICIWKWGVWVAVRGPKIKENR